MLSRSLENASSDSVPQSASINKRGEKIVNVSSGFAVAAPTLIAPQLIQHSKNGLFFSNRSARHLMRVGGSMWHSSNDLQKSLPTRLQLSVDSGSR